MWLRDYWHCIRKYPKSNISNVIDCSVSWFSLVIPGRFSKLSWNIAVVNWPQCCQTFTNVIWTEEGFEDKSEWRLALRCLSLEFWIVFRCSYWKSCRLLYSTLGILLRSVLFQKSALLYILVGNRRRWYDLVYRVILLRVPWWFGNCFINWNFRKLNIMELFSEVTKVTCNKDYKPCTVHVT